MSASSRGRVDYGLISAKEQSEQKVPSQLEASPSPAAAPLHVELSPHQTGSSVRVGAVCPPSDWQFPNTRESLGFPIGSAVKNPPAMQEPQETQFQSLGQEDPLEEGMATHPSILAWRLSWKEEPGGLRLLGSQRVRHD